MDGVKLDPASGEMHEAFWYSFLSITFLSLQHSSELLNGLSHQNDPVPQNGTCSYES